MCIAVYELLAPMIVILPQSYNFFVSIDVICLIICFTVPIYPLFV